MFENDERRKKREIEEGKWTCYFAVCYGALVICDGLGNLPMTRRKITRSPLFYFYLLFFFYSFSIYYSYDIFHTWGAN